MDYKEIVKKYQTPLFLFDYEKLKERVEYLKSKLPNLDLCYAIKANSFVVKEIEPLVERLEICSEGEYHICENLNINKNKMVLSGVNKNINEFDNIIKENENVLRYTIESLHQYKMLKEISFKYKRVINIMPRLTSGNQFGLSEDDIIQIIKDKNEFINIAGLEYFSGTQKHSLKRIDREFTLLKEFLDTLETEYKINIDEIEYGTGFPVYYFEGEEFDEDGFLSEFYSMIVNYFKDKKIILEIGRSLVASCGEYLTRVVDFKCNKTGKYVILDGGINHLVYYGSTMAMKKPYFEIIQNKITDEEEIINLCGSLCTVNDILVKQISVKKLNIDDLFVFKNTGAYSITEGINLFLSRDLPKVMLIKNNKCILLRNTMNSYKINTPNYEGE